MRLVFTLALLSQMTFASGPSLDNGVFWSRPCAGLLTAYLADARPFGPNGSIAFNSDQQSAQDLLRRFVRDEFGDPWEFNAHRSVFQTSKTTRWYNKRRAGVRLARLRDEIAGQRALVGIFDGPHRILRFLESFKMHTEALAEECQHPECFTDKGRLGTAALGLLGAGAWTLLSERSVHADYPSIVQGAMLALAGLALPFDFPLHFPRLRDGGFFSKPVVGDLFKQAVPIASNSHGAPAWLHWGQSVPFSLATLEELWDQGVAEIAPRNIVQALHSDDRLNAQTFMERFWHMRRIARIKDSEQRKDRLNATPLEIVDCDFVLFKKNTQFLNTSRLVVAFRLNDSVNRDDDDGRADWEELDHPLGPQSGARVLTTAP